MIRSDRNKFLAAHVTAPVKQALRDEAAKRGKSVSKIVFELLTARLRQLGHELSKEVQ